MPKFVASTEKVIRALKLSGCWVARQGKGDHTIVKRLVGKRELGTSIPKRKELGKGLLGSILDDLEISDQEFDANLKKV